MKFEPFQKVLVRDDESKQWTAAMYSHKRGEKYVCSGLPWKYCIPYEGHEKFIGTTNSPMSPEPKFAFGEHVEVSVDTEGWCKAVYIDKASDASIENTTLYRVLDVNGVVSLWEYCRKADW